MTNYIQELKNLFQRENCCCSDDDSMSEAEAKLARILQEFSSNNDGEDRKEHIETVNAFLAADEIQKRKILSYCLDFVDPTVSSQQGSVNGEQIQQHKFLQEDDLLKLYKFANRHLSDKSFGETVYKIMDKHGMTPPQVYKNAQLRRQDFSRATDMRPKTVTRQLAWQIIIGLRCSLEEADEVLFSAGFVRKSSRADLSDLTMKETDEALSGEGVVRRTSWWEMLDVIMEYFVRHENYDVMAINDVLDGLGIKAFSCYRPVKDNDNK